MPGESNGRRRPLGMQRPHYLPSARVIARQAGRAAGSRPLGQELRAIREAHNRTKDEAAQALGANDLTVVWDIEAGRRRVSLRELRALARMYDMPSWIILHRACRAASGRPPDDCANPWLWRW